MDSLIDLLVFYLGAIVGSFLNVCIYRLPREESIVSPPSHCPHCNTPIKPYDNLPVFSYLILRGRCRACGGKISPRYIAVEILTGVSFLFLSIFFAQSLPMFIISLVFASSLIVVIFIDIEHQIIPDEISLGGTGFGIAASLAYPMLHGTSTWRSSLIYSLGGIVVGAGLFWLIRIVGGKVFKKEAMGLGDVKLMAYVGSIVGPSLTLLTTFFAAFLGSAVGLTLIALKKAQISSRLPFGPFICIGAILAFLWGAQCIAWYLNFFH